MEAIAAGADEALLKPNNPNFLVWAVDKHMRRQLVAMGWRDGPVAGVGVVSSQLPANENTLKSVELFRSPVAS